MSRVHRPLPYIDRSSSLDEEVLCGADTPIESPSADALNQLNGTCVGECCNFSLLNALYFFFKIAEGFCIIISHLTTFTIHIFISEDSSYIFINLILFQRDLI